MQAVIDGKKYNTETADEICDISPIGYMSSDFNWHDTRLYRTKKGAFFLAGRGGPRSIWARSFGQHGSQGGEGIRPLSYDDARVYAEKHASVAMIEKYFKVEEA